MGCLQVLAAFLKAIGCIIPLMDAMYASYYTKEVMVVLVREFQTPDEEMKKIVLKVGSRLRCPTLLALPSAAHFAHFLLKTILPPHVDHCSVLCGLEECIGSAQVGQCVIWLTCAVLGRCAGGAAVRGDGGSRADLRARRDPAGVLPQLLGASHGARPPQLPRAR